MIKSHESDTVDITEVEQESTPSTDGFSLFSSKTISREEFKLWKEAHEHDTHPYAIGCPSPVLH